MLRWRIAQRAHQQTRQQRQKVEDNDEQRPPHAIRLQGAGQDQQAHADGAAKRQAQQTTLMSSKQLVDDLLDDVLLVLSVLLTLCFVRKRGVSAQQRFRHIILVVSFFSSLDFPDVAELTLG